MQYLEMGGISRTERITIPFTVADDTHRGVQHIPRPITISGQEFSIIFDVLVLPTGGKRQ